MAAVTGPGTGTGMPFTPPFTVSLTPSTPAGRYTITIDQGDGAPYVTDYDTGWGVDLAQQTVTIELDANFYSGIDSFTQGHIAFDDLTACTP
jgi:hypothetical protein